MCCWPRLPRCCRCRGCSPGCARSLLQPGPLGIAFLVLILYWLGQRSADSDTRPRRPAADGVAPVRHHPDRDRPHADVHAPPSPRRARLLGAEHRQRPRSSSTIWRLILSDMGYAISLPAIVLVTGLGGDRRSASGLAQRPRHLRRRHRALLGLAAVPAAHAFLLALIVRAVFMAAASSACRSRRCLAGAAPQARRVGPIATGRDCCYCSTEQANLAQRSFINVCGIVGFVGSRQGRTSWHR